MVHVGKPSPEYQDWARSTVYFHGFADLPTKTDQLIKSPKFFCLGYEWCVWLYPRGGPSDGWKGREVLQETMISVFLELCSSSVDLSIDYGIFIKSFNDSKQQVDTEVGTRSHGTPFCQAGSTSWGFTNNVARKIALSALVDGALMIKVRMKPDSWSVSRRSIPFIPDNPATSQIIQNLFGDEEDADVVFHVGGAAAAGITTRKGNNDK